MEEWRLSMLLDYQKLSYSLLQCKSFYLTFLFIISSCRRELNSLKLNKAFWNAKRDSTLSAEHNMINMKWEVNNKAPGWKTIFCYGTDLIYILMLTHYLWNVFFDTIYIWLLNIKYKLSIQWEDIKGTWVVSSSCLVSSIQAWWICWSRNLSRYRNCVLSSIRFHMMFNDVLHLDWR